MKVFEYAKEHGMTNKEVKQKFRLNHHLQEIPEEAPEVQETVTVEPVVEEPVTVVEEVIPALDVIELSIRCLGGKSQHWKYRHLVGK